jgi:thioesterase domain-containing protein
MSRIPVYFMPGLAASPTIFERIQLPEDLFEMYFLEWVLPNPDESLSAYAQRMASQVHDPTAILVGVSFGGILVQEMKAFLQPRKVLIISSVKSNREFPRRFKVARTTKAYKLLPTGVLQDVELLVKFALGDQMKRKLHLYENYLQMRDKRYLDWAIEQVICWERTTVDSEIIHIHGTHDEVFPLKYIQNCMPVKEGTHAMILSKYRWLNAHLPEILMA